MTEKHGERNVALYMALIIAAYVVIQSFTINANVFPADDIQELAFVNGMTTWTQLLGKDVFGLFRPIKNVLFGILSLFDSSDVSLFRIICVGIGVISFFPALGFCCKVFENERKAIVCAAVWFLSPTLVSSVAWLSCVNIQIMVALAIYAVSLHDDGHPVGASLCILFACFSYESAVAIGPVIVAFDYFLRAGRFRTVRGWRIYGVYASVTLLYLLLRWFAGSASTVNGSLAGVSRGELIGASAYFTLQHFAIWFWPFGNMAVFGGYSAGHVSLSEHVFCWCGIAALVSSAFILRRRAPRVGFGIAMALLAFLPTSNILGIGNGPYGDYYMGVASIGLSIVLMEIAAWLLSVYGRFSKFFVALGVGVLSIRAYAVVEAGRWAYLWADGERAYKATIATFPRAYYGYIVYAQMLCDRGDFTEALEYCDIAEQLIGMDEEKLRAINIVRAICAIRGEKNAPKALDLLDKCEKGCHQVSIIRSCRFYRGCVAEDLLNDIDLAKREYEAAIPERPGISDIQAMDRLARIYAIGGDVHKAIELWKKALRVNPGNFSVMWNLSIALHEVGDVDEAVHLQKRAKAIMNAQE